MSYQSKSRADTEAELEVLTARLKTGGSELEGNTQLETISEIKKALGADRTNSQDFLKESTAEAAQVERLEAQLAVEQTHYRKLKQELEDLQAEYNKLKDSRDTWKETIEALEHQIDVKAARALSRIEETLYVLFLMNLILQFTALT